jgi:hypothetical protein
MPRISAEARSAANYRCKGKAPSPPPHLDPESKRIWRSICHSKSVDYFSAGSEPLLEAYVTSLVTHRFYMNMWHTDTFSRNEYVKAIVGLNNSLAQLATKLRLAITSVDRRAGILMEKGDFPHEEPPENVTLLFGGPKVQW